MEIYPHLFREYVFPFYESKLRKRNTPQLISEYQSSLRLDPHQLEALQWERLTALLTHCWESVPFYQQSWKALGIDGPNDIKTMADFQQLPVLSKDLVQKNYQQLLSTRSGPGNIKKSTGGSTGQPFRFEYNPESDIRRQAVMWRGYGWLGAGLGVKTLYLWGADLGKPSWNKQLKDRLYNRYYNRKILSSFAMNQDNLSQYVSAINSYRPKAMVSYVAPLVELSRHILKTNCKVFSPSRILTGAEPLLEFQRELIESAFQTKVYNTYGCREVMLMAAECELQSGLHINNDHLVLEILNEEKQALLDQVGDVTLTDLFNYGMPLIRYQNGDRAIASSQACLCGNPLPMLKSIEGRKLDIIKTPSGAMLPGELFPHMFKEFAGIERFQVRQKLLSEVSIVIVRNTQYTDNDEAKIAAEIAKYANDIALNFEYVDSIALTPSGKHRVTICELDDAK